MCDTSRRKDLVGVNVAMPTFFKPDFSIDCEMIQTHTRFIVESGIRRGDGVLLCLGAGGESCHLTEDERVEVTRAMIEAADGAVPVVVGVTHNSTMQAVRLAKEADKLGAYGVQVAPPYYFLHSADEVFRHVKAISEEIDIGISLYNIPYTCSVDMNVEFVSRCMELGNVIGLKWYTPNLYLLREMYLAMRDRVNIIDNVAVYTGPLGFILGAVGFASQTANFDPAGELELLRIMREKRYDQVYPQMSKLVMPYYDLRAEVIKSGISGEGNFIKAMIDLIGRHGGPSRPPHVELPQDVRERFAKVIRDAGIAGRHNPN